MDKKYLKILLCAALVVGLSIAVARAMPVRGAFWDQVRNFFVAPQAVDTAPIVAEPAPLYKPVIEYERAVIDAVKRASPAVVSIVISKNVPIIENCIIDPFGNLPPEVRRFFGDLPQITQPCERGTEFKEVGGGSGFIVSKDGLVVTNRHVAADSKAAYTVFTNDGKKYSAKVLARDPVQDLAVLKVETGDFPILAFGDSDGVELGQTAIAIGNALGEYRNTISLGVISGLGRTVEAAGNGGKLERLENVLQTDAAINRGNSGGPLLNLRGEVIGINTAMANGAENIGFAIPINLARRAIESVKRFGEIQTPYIGVRYSLITSAYAKREKLELEYGALVRDSDDGLAVMPDSPAEKAGIKAGDIIVEVNGRKIDKDNSLANALNKFSVGDKVGLKIYRGGSYITLSVILEKRPE